MNQNNTSDLLGLGEIGAADLAGIRLPGRAAPKSTEPVKYSDIPVVGEEPDGVPDAVPDAEPQRETAREPAGEPAKEQAGEVPEIKASPGKLTPALQELYDADPTRQLEQIKQETRASINLLEQMRGLRGSAFLEKKAQFDRQFLQAKRTMDDYLKGRLMQLCMEMSTREQFNYLANDRVWQKKKTVEAILQKVLTFDSNDLEELFAALRSSGRLSTSI